MVLTCPEVLTMDSISIAAWNICGIQNKISDPDFLYELKSHDIVILGETFAKSDSLHVEGFKCKNIFYSKKHKKAKRHSGGVSVLIKDSISNFVTPIRTTGEHFIWLKISQQLTGYPMDMFCCCAYIPPYGSPYYATHPDCNLFDSLNADLTHFSNLGHVFVSGDLNSRIGTKPDTLLDSEINPLTDNIPNLDTIKAPPRHSMDSKVNVWGNKLIDLCIAHNLCLLNGRTLGDFSGKFTFFGAGCSVIDVALVDEHLLQQTLAFKVHKFLPDFSGHCKIETILACLPTNISVHDPACQNLTFNKYIWNKQLSEEKLLKAMDTVNFRAMKHNILSTDYDTNCLGTEALSDDVDKAFAFLHEHCDLVRVGKKSRVKAKRQKWFSPDLSSLRKQLRRAANHLHRHPFDRKSSDEVFSIGKKYKKLLKKTKKLHLENNMKKLINSVDRQEMWGILSDIKGKKSSAPIPMHVLYDHFKSVLNNAPRNVLESKIQTLATKIEDFKKSKSPPEDKRLTEGGYTPEHVNKIVKTLKNGKSSFIDGSINEVIKHSISSTSSLLTKLFNHIERSATYPKSWKSSFLVPLHKKGSQGDANNYRGLALGNNISKVYTKSLYSKIKKFSEDNNLLSPHQFGFRDDFRTADAAFSLRSIVSNYKMRNKPVYACFVDFSKAFDSVNRTALAYKLGRFGIKGNMLKLLQDMYTDVNYILKANGNFSTPIPSKIGVKQGCNLSPLLFNIFINDIHDCFQESSKPTFINGWKVNSLSFADDLVLLSETESGLRNSIASLESYCKEWGLKVNHIKTNVLVFNKPFSKNIKKLYFSIDGNQIKITNSYCYLGIEMSNTGSFVKAVDVMYKKALKALFSVYSSLDVRADLKSIPIFLKLFDSLVKPVLLYGSEIWGSSIISGNNPINKFTNKFYRTLLGVPRNTSNVGIHAELGRFPIHVNAHQSMVRYWFRLITLPMDRLAAHCYWSLFDNSNITDPWLNSMSRIINSTGQYYVWSQQKHLASENKNVLRKHKLYICRTLGDLAHQATEENIGKETKLDLFNKSKTVNTSAKYLNRIENRKKRSLICKLRLGTLDLEIEKSRRLNIPRAERVCKLCNSGEIEDVVHFILKCPRLGDVRKNYIMKLSSSVKAFSRLTPEEKIKRLYFNESIGEQDLLVATDLLHELKESRDTLLS